MMILLVVFGPLAVGLLCLLSQRGLRTWPLVSYALSMAAGLYVLSSGITVRSEYVGTFGIALLLDRSAAWFILLNSIISIAVAWHERYRGRHHYFFILLAMLHGCVNACFVSNDLFNLYVVIELTTIAAFLLLGQGMTPRHLWNALRYIFLSNVGMLFYLLGTLLVYASAGDFLFSSVAEAPPTARAMIMVGLLSKGGVFLSGLWLPQAHAEADGAVSALLSGVVVNVGLLPLLRLESYSVDLAAMLRIAGLGSMFMGLALALCQRDIKRLLACSTISQAGFIILSPVAGPLYAFAHGIAKSGLFLGAGNLRERDLITLRKTGGDATILLPMKVAVLSLSGFPLFAGFAAKQLLDERLTGSTAWLAALASIGTACVMAPVIFMPLRKAVWKSSPFWQAPMLLSGVLLVSGLICSSYTVSAMLKAVAVFASGIGFYLLAGRKLMKVSLPDNWEKLEHVVGLTCIALLLLILGVYLP